MCMEKLKDALRVFTEESCEFLVGQPPGVREWIQIVRQSDGSTSFPAELRPDFSDALLRLQMRIHNNSSPAFDRCVEVVRQDPRLKDALLVDAGGKPIEDKKAARWWLANTLAGGFVHAYVNRANGVQFDEQVFFGVFEELSRDVESSDITVTELSPLTNAEIESDRIQIDPGIQLRQIGIVELEEWLNADRLFPFQSQPLTFHELLGLKCAVEVVYKQNRYSALGSKFEVYEKVQRLITAMRLLTDASPRLAFTKTRTPGLFRFGLSTSWSLSTYRLGSLAKIDKTHEQELVGLYKRLDSSPNKGKAALALARWNSASDKLAEEDKLIDYWIAMESLFVPETAQELSYRVTLRIAAFLGSDGLERQRIYNEMKDSYRLRSEIVHGSIRKRKRKLTTVGLTNLTRSYLRRTLLKILELGQPFDPKKLETQLLAK